MLRSIFAGVLAVSALSACKSDKSDTSKVAVGTAAGKVVEITGKVQATRGGATRDLAMGAEVFADDEVKTAADATVTIELFHNNARWAVISNKTGRVDASLAWGLDKQQATKTVEHNSAAAGRNAERSGANTSATAEEKKEESMPAAAPASADMPAPEPAAAPPEQPTAAAPPPPPPPPPVRDAKPMADTKQKKSAPRGLPGGTAAGGASKDVAIDAVAETAVAGKASAVTNQSVLEAKRAALAKCATNVTLTIEVRASDVVVTGVEGTAKTCVENVVKALDWPVRSGKVTLKL